MNWDAISAVGEIAGAFAVFASLMYLAIQIKHSNNFMKAQAFQERSNALQDLRMRVAESEVLSRVQSLVIESNGEGTEIMQDAVDSLTSTEFNQFRNFLTAHAYRLQNLIRQYELGFMEKKYHDSSIVFTIKIFRPAWTAFRVSQGKALQIYVESYEKTKK
jgi:hypothetical protein